MISHKQFRRWYRHYNRRFFGEALPNAIEVLYVPVEGCCADVRELGPGHFVIRVNPLCTPETRGARLALLHEMAHIKLWPTKTHGRAFQAEMQRLAMAGAFQEVW